MLRRIVVGSERLAARRVFCCLAIAALVLAVRLSLLPILPKPSPEIHDEFSYLLGGETFAMGRLTNAPHPLAAFFETFHVNLHPTYASKYPPGQAAFLAIGIKWFGHPWYGVWLSVGLMCGLLTWMLQGWVAPKWALLGGILTIPWFALTHAWMNSYWGGAVAASGGALVLGALPRLVRKPSTGAACAFALGAGVLANSRPYEGAVLSLAALVAVLWWARREGRFKGLFRRSVVLPIALIGLLTGGWIRFYNYRLTGTARSLPYSINQQTYATTPVLWVLPPLPPPQQQHEYRDRAMRNLWVWDASAYTSARRMPLIMFYRVAGAASELLGDLGQPLLLPLALSLLLVRLRRVGVVLGLGVIFTSGLLLEKYAFSHYLAPATGILLLLVVFGLRFLNALKLQGNAVGIAVVAVTVGISFASSGLALKRTMGKSDPLTVPSPTKVRRQTEAKLLKQPGSHVVIVHYGDTHDMHQELVYNGPDIDGQKIVWAFDRGPAKNVELIDYYAGRKFWLLEPDPPDQRLELYPSSPESGWRRGSTCPNAESPQPYRPDRPDAAACR